MLGAQGEGRRAKERRVRSQKGLLFKDHIWGSVPDCGSPPCSSKKENHRDRSARPPSLRWVPALGPHPSGLSGGGDREEGGQSLGLLQLLGTPLQGLAGASRPWGTLARGAALRPTRREPSPGLGLDSPLSTSLPFLAIAVFPMTRETASRGDGGEGTGAVPPPRSLQQLPLLLSSRRSRSAASGRAEQPGVGEEMRRALRQRQGLWRWRRADTPPSRARPPGAPPAPRAPGSRTPGARPRDRSFFASRRAHRKWRWRKPPGRRELFCAGLGWWPVPRLALEGQSRGSGGTWKPLAWKNYESFLRLAPDALEPSGGHGAGARPAPASGWCGFRTQRLLTQGRFFWVVGGTYTCPSESCGLYWSSGQYLPGRLALRSQLPLQRLPFTLRGIIPTYRSITYFLTGCPFPSSRSVIPPIS